MKHYEVVIVRKIYLYVAADSVAEAHAKASDEADYQNWDLSEKFVASVTEIDENDIP